MTLWFLDRGKRRTDRADSVLFIDAREIYNQIDRAHRDWTPQQIEFLANIVRLWRGEKPEFLSDSQELLENYFPEQQYRNVPALCAAIESNAIATQDWSLSPGRFIDSRPYVAPHDFEKQMAGLVEEFRHLHESSVKYSEIVEHVIQSTVQK